MNAYSGQLRAGHDGRGKAFVVREERRETVLRGWFTRTCDESIWDFLITNLSYGGCELRTGADLQVGEKVRLSVISRGMITATVRWRSGEKVGLAFNVERAPAPHWPRKVDRHKAAINVLVRRPGRKSQWIEASDVSRLGCCLHFVDAPREGDRLWVQLPCLEPIETEVRWVKNFQVGVAFAKPIHSSVFDLLVDMWKGQPA